MDDKFPLRVAVDQAWTVHLATHTDIDAADPRRCSLERYLSGRWEAGESDPEELTCYGLSYLARGESWMANFTQTLNRLVSRSARPDWTLAAVASLIAAGITASVRLLFG